MRCSRGRATLPITRGCVRREGTSEAAPEAVRQAVGGGCLSGWGRLLSATNANRGWRLASWRQWLIVPSAVNPNHFGMHDSTLRWGLLQASLRFTHFRFRTSVLPVALVLLFCTSQSLTMALSAAITTSSTPAKRCGTSNETWPTRSRQWYAPPQPAAVRRPIKAHQPSVRVSASCRAGRQRGCDTAGPATRACALRRMAPTRSSETGTVWGLGWHTLRRGREGWAPVVVDAT